MKYFGTDGIRGRVNDTINADIAFKVGAFLAYHYSTFEKKPKILLGYDTRISKDLLASSVCAGLCAHGADVYTLSVTSTPNIAYLLGQYDFDCGIMISASHNPYYDNGIKVFNSIGEKLESKIEQQIEEFIDGKISINQASSDKIGQIYDYSKGKLDYIDFLASNVDKSKFKTLKIALDLANGSACALVEDLSEKLDVEFLTINSKPNGLNINTNCGSTHPESLQKFVVENNCDLGLAFDGDADRVIAVDQLGRLVDGDLIMYLCAKYLASQGRLKHNCVVTTIMSNIGLYKAFDKAGIEYCKVNVGDKFVYAKMKEDGYSLGGEQSGHIIIKEKMTTGDGILTGLILADIIAKNTEKLSDLVDEVMIYPQLLQNIHVKNKDYILNNQNLLNLIDEVSRELGDDGRILVRASGTEQLIRVMVEAATTELCTQHVAKVIDLITDIEN